ncbi:hypothetical protein N7520_006918 [Penicillium odoratum]|uniref:uncharacterized protein n=1 Tax=Penicillium odoratum TaxID=1167516 RepID=UPI0025477E16|nr:uncharacterized protein N7520_006918 [Penicillium odoratum]KAJ5759762.1 hypothetical protein N7520_006918 [Penicillium odoratum]
MASHHLAIAKASFSAGLLRPDPTSVHRDEITIFHTSLERALSHCSPANIQTCKAWLLHYVASSANRLAGLAKYLVALAASLDIPGAQPKSSPKRRRLHILYLLNDLFHHSKYHLDTTATFSTVSGSLQPHMVDLLGHTAAYDKEKNPRHHRRLEDLLDLWSEHGYFSPDLIHRLREVIKHSASAGAAPLSNDFETDGADPAKLLGRDAPFIMPSSHGDHSTPYYDLPAGNWLPHLIPNSTIPLHPESIKPLQFLAGPADQTLVNALKGFLIEVDQIYDTEELVPDDENADIDELGQRITRDEITGDILDGETYYGWSREFCRKMKKKTSGPPSRSHSQGQGHKRRYSDSSLSESRRSDSPPRNRSRAGHEGRQYGSRPRSKSRSPRRSRSRESSYSPREPSPPRFPPPHQPSHAHPPPSHAIPPTPSHDYGQYGFSAQPPPPPPPPPYAGGWPPAPPPQMPAMPFPPGPSMSHPAFPPAFYPPQQMNLPPGQPMPPGQPLPPGQYRFPPPHSGGQHGPPAGRGWR